jgi:hypothetical protein
MDTVVEGYTVTPQGWRQLGSGTLTSSGSKTPGLVVPAAVAIATANPIGLIVVGGAKSIARRAAGANSRVGPRRPPTKLQSNSKSDSRTGAGSSERKRCNRCSWTLVYVHIAMQSELPCETSYRLTLTTKQSKDDPTLALFHGISQGSIQGHYLLKQNSQQIYRKPRQGDRRCNFLSSSRSDSWISIG